MVCPGLTPREGTTYATCLSNKLTSYVLAYMNAISCTLHLLTMVFQPSTLGTVFENMNKTQITVFVLLSIAIAVFAFILLIGLHKNRRSFITAFLIFCGVYMLWIIMGTLVILFTRPSLLGFRGFFINIFDILFYFGLFYVISYYRSVTYT